jgi:hypothetical protein
MGLRECIIFNVRLSLVSLIFPEKKDYFGSAGRSNSTYCTLLTQLYSYQVLLKEAKRTLSPLIFLRHPTNTKKVRKLHEEIHKDFFSSLVGFDDENYHRGTTRN